MNTFQLTVSSPDGNRFRGEVAQLMLRGVEGDLAVLAGHIPFVTAVVPGDCRIEMPDGTERIAHTDGGLLTVGKETVTLMAGGFVWKE